MERRFVSIGSALAFLAVALGAFGTHTLKSRVSPPMLEIWHTGVQYHLAHAMALVLVGIIGNRVAKSSLVGWLFVAGVAIFSGTLYLYVLTGIVVFAIITPLGGLCLVSGWLLLAVDAARPTSKGS